MNNKTIKTFGTILACLALTGTCLAAPHGGHHGHRAPAPMHHAGHRHYHHPAPPPPPPPHHHHHGHHHTGLIATGAAVVGGVIGGVVGALTGW